MTRTRRTLAETIAGMARETGVPNAFVERVRAMFEEKGIPLDADAAPFERALGDVFAREAAVHARLELARRHTADFEERRDALRRGSRPAKLLRLVPGDRDRFLVPGPDGLQ